MRRRIAQLEGVERPNLAPILARITALETQLDSLEADFAALETSLIVEDWHAPTLLNGWVNAGAPYLNAGYRKDPFGVVHLRGMVITGTVNTVLFTLPVGYRPSASMYFTITSAASVARLLIEATGNVTITQGSSTWTSLNGVTFLV